MMIEIVFPRDNEKEFIAVAERLGLDGLCFVYDNPVNISGFQRSTRLKLFSAPLCTERNIQKFRNQFTVMDTPDDQQRIRIILEQHRPSLLFNLESAARSDFIHHRASGLNQVLARIARDNRVLVGFSFSSVLDAPPKRRAVLLGRLSQNIVFARKFGFQVCIASFAARPYQLRSPNELKSFFIALGMHPSEADSALKNVFKRLETHIKS